MAYGSGANSSVCSRSVASILSPISGSCEGLAMMSAPANPGAATTLCRRVRAEEHTSELQSRCELVCRLLLEKKKLWRSPRVGKGPLRGAWDWRLAGTAE